MMLLEERPATRAARDGRDRPRLAVIATHPIPYCVPLYRAIEEMRAVELQVLFCSRIGLETYFDAGFGQEIRWKSSLLAGYPHVFLDDGRIESSAEIPRMDNPSIGKALAAFRPDCVLIQGYSVKTMRRALAAANRSGTPVLMIADSAYPDHVSFPKSVIKRVVLSYLYKRISGFFAMGDRGRAYHLHYGAPADRIYFCPYTIDEPLFDATRRERDVLRNAVRARMGLGRDDTCFLFCGKLTDRKRPIDLVEAAALLRKRHPDSTAVLAFCGDGPLRTAIGETARAHGVRTILLGFHNMDTLGEIYCAADALVLASEREPYGVVLSEATFFGLPLIVSDEVGAVGPTSIARDGDNATVVTVGDTGALAETMWTMLDPVRREAMGRRSRIIYEQQSTAVCAANLVAAVLDVLPAQPSHARN